MSSTTMIGGIQAAIETTREQDAVEAAELSAWLEELAGSYNLLPMDVACCCE